jgi:predicted AlkP superfamily pyrophosphatase or phosphodiesterase
VDGHGSFHSAPRGRQTVPMDDTTPKALVVGLDGVRHDVLVRTPTPRLDELAGNGFLARSLLYPRRPEVTASGPGWSSIATGVWPDKHLVRDNTFAGNRLSAYPDFLTRLQDAGRRTYAGLGWRPLGGVFGEGVGTRLVRDAEREGFAVADRHVVAHACEHLANADLDAAFVYIGAVDECGHELGVGDAYAETLQRADADVGRLLDAVASRPGRDAEGWLVLAVTDHGHRDEGHHGGQSEVERTAWVVASGNGVAEPDRAVEVVDVAPTVFAHLGLPVEPGWSLDGRSLV